MRHLSALCLATLVLGTVTPAVARSKLHVWTDAEGVTHVDDLPPPGAPVRARRASPPAGPAETRAAARPATQQPKVRAGHWWERATDAPPDEIDKAAALYKIPAELIRAVIAVESAGDTSAVSHRGAIGLMQLMPKTAGSMYVEDPVDPRQNIQGGTRYLRTLANEFKGDMMLVLAAYNAGPEAVRKYGGVPPFEETRGYVRKVMAYYAEYKRASARRGQLASADAAPKAESRP
jgi:soluble lytic murein transglycosylase-like protein